MTLTDTRCCYVFAVVDADLADDAVRQAPGDSALLGDVRLLRCGPVAAVVGTLTPDQPLGRAADLRAHEQVVAGLVASGVGVLPLRFGSVVADEGAVVEDVLSGHLDELTAGLDRVRGCTQFKVTATYQLDAVLAEVLADRPEIAALRGQQASMSDRIRLGEQVVRALGSLRVTDAPPILDRVSELASDVHTTEPGAPETVVQLAALVRNDRAARFMTALEDCGRRQGARMRIRVVGPVAPYDFVPEH